MSKPPPQKPGRSKQDYSTPIGLLQAIHLRFYEPDWDLAAYDDGSNSVAPNWYGPSSDSLSCLWGRSNGRCFLNPPFSHIAPWAKKCSESECPILFLVPASVGSEWFAKYVDGIAYVMFLRGRLSFDGKGPFPKDCLLAGYNLGEPYKPGYEVWDWRSYANM